MNSSQSRDISLISLLLTITASALLIACSSDAKSSRLAGDAVILAFGDSLIFGTGASPAESYPMVLESLVGRRVVNSGVPGEVTADGVSRLPEVIEKEKPALVILCHGGNDLIFPTVWPVPVFLCNINKISLDGHIRSSYTFNHRKQSS